MNVKKAVAAEWKKWQAKGKALLVEKVNQLFQMYCLEEVIKGGRGRDGDPDRMEQDGECNTSV